MPIGGIMSFYIQQAPGRISACHHTECDEQFETDLSHRFGVGISHYRRDGETGEWTRSYVQVFKTFHCCTRPHALEVAHSNVDSLKSLPFGQYDQAVHNPVMEQSHQVARANVEYNQDGLLPESALPTVDALTGEKLENDRYLPHVDDSTRGLTYQSILGSHATLGTATLEGAIELCHRLLDEVLEADFQGQELPGLVEVDLNPAPPESENETPVTESEEAPHD